MTVTYTREVATCKKFGCFIKLLARWRGSIYKLVWMDLLLFLFLYYSINMVYLYFLTEESKRTFENVVYYCASYSSLIPLSFVLGFYVNLVMSRWWEQYTMIPWPDSIAVFVSAHVHGLDEDGRVIRRTVMRYVCLCLTIVFTMISPGVKKRFPKLKNLVDAGLLLENEKKIIQTMDTAFPKYPKHWMPIVWAAGIITRARNEGRIRDDFAHKTIIDELNHFRAQSGSLMYYDLISIPLVYTQVVTIAVYTFFVCTLLAHQWTELKRDTYESFDFSMPIFITMEFFFYMGWLKVAETLINPFGEDDDDFEINWMIDRNLQVSYLIVDEMHHEHPELVKDQYWDEIYPTKLPYDANAKREQHPEASTAKYGIDHPEKSTTMINIPLNTSNVLHQNSLISIHNERLKQTLQRFSQISVDDAAETRGTRLSTNPSLTDIESVQCITSYSKALGSEESITFKMEDQKTKMYEEEDIDFEFEEEEEEEEEEVLLELTDVDEEEEEEEEHGEEASLIEETDSDYDPFISLIQQRLQERIDRTNAFLQNYFGNNYKLATPVLLPEPGRMEVKNKASKPKVSKSEVVSSNKTSSIESKSRDEQTPSITFSSQLTMSSSLDREHLVLVEPDIHTVQNNLVDDGEQRNINASTEVLTVLSSSGKKMITTSSQTSLNASYADVRQQGDDTATTSAGRLTKDVAISPMSSVKSFSTMDSSDVGDWDLVGIDSVPSVPSEPEEEVPK